jgi:hypothetical protein
MVFRNSVFNLLRAGSKFRRIAIILSIIGFFYWLSILIFSSSASSSSPFIYSTLYKTDVSFIGESNSLKNGDLNVSRKAIQLDPRISAEELNRPPLPQPFTKEAANKPLAIEVLHEDEQQKLSSLPECPSIEDNKDLKGHVGQAGLLIEDLLEDEVAESHPYIKPGGHWKPKHCRSKRKVAIIIPYRDRYSHLMRLLNFLFPILRAQLLDFRFIVTEQYGTDLFNKGRIMNAAFRLAEKLQVDCVIFHDVDMFPQDDRTPYDCPEQPRHIGAFVSNLGYALWYQELVGGVLALTMDDYRSINGYSNLYWAWGGEDDDMGKRLLSQNYTIERPNKDFARFSMLKHGKRKRTAPKLIYKNLETAGKRWETDGLNVTGQWKIVKLNLKPLYYHLIIDVGEPPKEWRSQ